MADQRIVTRELLASEAVDAEAASYTLKEADSGAIVRVTAGSAANVTVPPASSVNFPVGTEITIIQSGAGAVTVVAGAGVTLQSKEAHLKVAAQHARVRLVKLEENVWNVSGDLIA
jgi:hypothetical protein